LRAGQIEEGVAIVGIIIRLPTTLDHHAEEYLEILVVCRKQEGFAHKHPDIELPTPNEEAQVVIRCVAPPSSHRMLN
jgi:hypothetical protein